MVTASFLKKKFGAPESETVQLEQNRLGLNSLFKDLGAVFPSNM